MRITSIRDLLVVSGGIAGALGIVTLAIAAASGLAEVIGAILLGAGWAMLGVSAVGSQRPLAELRMLHATLEANDERQLSRTRRLETAIESERAKESRHEYIQERALERIEARLREATGGPVAPYVSYTAGNPTDILFVTSNGAGLGHLTRLLAVAKHLRADHVIKFLTLSRAYQRVASMGYPISYFPSAEVAEVGTSHWNSRFRRHLQTVFAESTPKIVVFDGTVVYEALVDVCRGYGVPLIWMQRGCWKREADARYPARKNASLVADRVIIPGDFAVDETVDVGSGVSGTHVGPISLLSRMDLLTRQDALRELGLSPDHRHILMNLGGGALSDSDVQFRIIEEVAQRCDKDVQVSIVRSPLGKSLKLPSAVNLIEAYPVAKFAKAFEFVISASGYNSVQEAASLGIPSIFFPNLQTQTDDQHRRATGAVERGWAVMATTNSELVDEASRLVNDRGALERLHVALEGLGEPTGAVESAEILKREVLRSQWFKAGEKLT